MGSSIKDILKEGQGVRSSTDTCGQERGKDLADLIIIPVCFAVGYG